MKVFFHPDQRLHTLETLIDDGKLGVYQEIPEHNPYLVQTTKLPHTAAGAISATYMGATIEAAPMPTPPRMRNATNSEKLAAAQNSKDERAKHEAQP